MKNLILLAVMFFSLNAFAMGIPDGFTQEKVKLDDGITLNVYKGGKGDPLLLIHGYAQSALMWSPVMEKFKDKFTIIVPDLRGAGLSDAPSEGYDKVTMAGDMEKLLEHYHISKARVVGHDIGLMVAYALAAEYPTLVEKLVLMDAFIPGVGAGDEIYNSPTIWHFRFNGPYPEQLVKGRESVFFDSLWEGFAAKPHAISDSDKKYYLSQYSRPGRMHAGFGYFKSMPQDAKDNKELSKTKLPMPVLALGGAQSMGQPLVDSAKVVSPSSQGKVINGCGHWMIEECPGETIAALEGFL
jgi:pimeloyl-ACP methyl ester carboxylesterase